jgi:hypothetical protein
MSAATTLQRIVARCENFSRVRERVASREGAEIVAFLPIGRVHGEGKK